jgi:hypothetical protein
MTSKEKEEVKKVKETLIKEEIKKSDEKAAPTSLDDKKKP